MPSIAPLVAAWRRRMANLPGPLAGTGEASNGEPVQVEMWINGEWVDITSYVMVRDDQGRISITYGLRDEGSQTEQARSTLPLRNTDGRFTRRNPTGPYYGIIGRNTPIRISVPDGMGGKSYRQQAEISKWPKGWDPTGTDVWVDISADGILQRLAQAPPPEHSVIYNAVTDPLATSVVAYWPCEDASGSTQLASTMTSGSPMTWSGTPALASYAGFAASDPLPDLTAASLSGGVARYDDPTATQVRFLASIPKGGLSDGKVLCAVDQFDYSAGSPQFWELFYTTTGNTLWLRQCAGDGTLLGVELVHTLDVRGRQLYVSIELQETGASVNRALRLTDVTTGTVYSVTDTAAATALSRVTGVRFGPASRSAIGPFGTQFLPGVAVGHVTVETTITATNALGVRLNPIGETAGRRVQRLCAENGIPFDWVGDLDDTAALGAQGKQNPLNLIQEAVLADGGMLYENRAVLGLGYRTRTSLYSQDPALVLDYTAYQLSEIPAPVEDDRYLANKVVVSVNGVTATYEQTEGPLSTALPPAGVGVYGANAESPVTLNLATSDGGTLLDQAAWRVHLGTVDEDRFPQISVNLAHPTFVNNPAMRQAVLALRLGDRIQVTNPPLWVGPDTMDQLVLGLSEEITHFEHRLTFTCAPASPYNGVGNLDTADVRPDTDGSELYTAVTSTATEIDVVPSAGLTGLWTTGDDQPPWDIRVGGERMTVDAVYSKAGDSFTRTESNTWGVSGSGHTWTSLFGAASDRSVDGTRGVMTLTTSLNSVRINTLVDDITDAEVLCKITPGQVSLTQPFVPGIILRYINSATFYRVRIFFHTDTTVWLDITNGTSIILAAVPTGRTYAAGDAFWIRARVDSPHRVRARVWRDDEAEPAVTDWHVDQAVPFSTANSGAVGVSCNAISGITNPSLTAYFDNFYLLSPQTMSVTRSVNGVVKAHTAGEAVALADPTYLAL